jgi:hypothetical protein
VQNTLTLELDEQTVRDAESLAAKRGIPIEDFLARILVEITSSAE